MQIKDRQQFLTILAISAITLLALDKIVWPPLERLWSDRAVRIKNLQDDVKDGERLIRRKDAIRSHWNQIEASTLTNNTSVAEQQLFNGFDRWSQASGVTINSMVPNWKQSAENDYKTIECRVDAKGNIAALSQFLYQIERDPMALKLQSVELTASDPEGQQLALGLQVSGLVLTPNEQRK